LEEKALNSFEKETEKSGWRKRTILVNDNFVNLKRIVKEKEFGPVSGILFDLGVSSWHPEESGRGFSFLKDEPLDMRFGAKSGRQAGEILNKESQSVLAGILENYGEEKFALRIAKAIAETRKAAPIKTTFQLLEIIRQATPDWYHHQKIHFATRTFQALRIAVNNELENLEKALPQALEILSWDGRIGVISFHSLEDRIVKNFFREEEKKNTLKTLTKKPIVPQKSEMKANPRSRSAKLRLAIKI